MAMAKAPPRTQCLRCRSFASIFSRGTTGRADSTVSWSSKCGDAGFPKSLSKLCSFIFNCNERYGRELYEEKLAAITRPQIRCNGRPVSDGEGDLKPSDLVHGNNAV